MGICELNESTSKWVVSESMGARILVQLMSEWMSKWVNNESEGEQMVMWLSQ